MNKKEIISLKSLFLLFFQIGGMTFGGGYAMMPVMHDEVVHKRKWISENEFVNILAIAQSFPGALAVNSAIYVGYRLRGKKGAFISCMGVIIPPFFIIILASAFLMKHRDTKQVQLFFRGVRPSVAALIAVSIIKLSKSIPQTWLSLVLALISFIAVGLLKVHPAIIILISGIFGILVLSEKGDK